MVTARVSEVLRHLGGMALLPAERTDRQLLEDYLVRRDEAALGALVRRHGPMVWGVCRRVLANHHDAEDAFQATFLVLTRKAASIASRELLANWLYGVAHQTALNARTAAARRRERETQVAEMPEPAATAPEVWSDLRPVLDEELSRLPDRFRAVLVSCDLGGKTRKEAARQLGVPEGTVAGWLARARQMLAKRLAQRGVALSGGALAAVLSEQASAGVPTSVVSHTIKAASVFADGPTAVSAEVAALTEGVLKAMPFTKLKGAIATALLVAVLVGGAGLVYATQGGNGPNEKNAAKSPPAGTVRLGDGIEGGIDVSKSVAEGGEGGKPGTDLQRLQGTWKLVETHKHGKKVDAKDIPTEPHALVVDGSRIALHYTTKGWEPTKGTLELNTGATPREMNITWAITGWQAIYRLEGDRLTICFNPDNGVTPDAFRTTADSGRVLYVYQRAKDAEKSKTGEQAVPSAPDKGDAKTGTKWEYKKLSHDEIKALEFKKRGTDTADGGLNMLGEEGWELVAIEPPERVPVGGRPALYVFKRQKR